MTPWSRIGGAAGFCVAALALALPSPVTAKGNALSHAGPVRIGDRLADLQQRARWTYDANTSLNDCQYYAGGLLPPGISMMVLDGVVVRFDTHAPTGTGPFGLRLGDTRAAALRKLPSPPTHLPAEAAQGIARLRWPAHVSARAPQALGLQADLQADGTVDHLSWGRMRDVTNASACL